MFALPLIALFLGGLLGLRFNVWALLACLSAIVPAVGAMMLLSPYGFTSAMFITFLVAASLQTGYLASTYSVETVMRWRVIGSGSIPRDR